MTDQSQAAPLFGDLLARARQSWVREMALRLTSVGFPDYRASDALVLRLLRHGPLAFARFTSALGVSRQAARKVVDGLVARDLAVLHVDEADGRRRIVTLTRLGDRYGDCVVAVIEQLNEEVSQKIEPEMLAATREALTFIHTSLGTATLVS